ncbi:hypothetical protein XBKQ1_1780014 [Xenorhabdus bovienii str. kraussei Quebec]|uniref:Uncharacterized protein n=1 Tax=Xenorhabdus bovienii str. kraussei Quebec TaxID=1398203 RepID=A0A077P3F4_XENBV|nr:hypothetical protein XBKQ1_1780014 [Xenorhabdus bovienii str. kraussei Quebec]
MREKEDVVHSRNIQLGSVIRRVLFFTYPETGYRVELPEGRTGFYPVYGGSGLTGAGHSPGCAPVAASSSAGEKTVEPYMEQ